MHWCNHTCRPIVRLRKQRGLTTILCAQCESRVYIVDQIEPTAVDDRVQANDDWAEEQGNVTSA
jgi:hypothetical protein